MTDNGARDELMVGEETGGELAVGMPPMAIGGALAAGILGAAVWAGIAIVANYEIGWIAWGIGAAIGAAFHKLGGRGAAGPLLCAAIAVASIGAGKYVAFRTSVSNELEEILGSEMLQMGYASYGAFGAEYAAAQTDEEREALAREWIVDEGQDPSSVSAHRLEHFRQNELPEILAIQKGDRSFEQFKSEFTEAAMADVSFADTLGGFDLLWIALGVMTAWRLASGTAEA
jgi:hypothetical protein